MKVASYTTFTKDVRAKGLEYALQHSAALGFDAIEVIPSRRDPVPTRAQVKAARSRFDAYGLPVVCYSAVADLYTDSAADVETLKRHAEFAAVLGSPYLHHTLFHSLSQKENLPAYGEMLPRVVEAAARVADYAATLGITCLYEPQGLYFNGIEGLGQFFAEIKAHCPNVGICADAGNPLFVHCDPIALAHAFAKDVRHVHVKNYSFSKTEPTADERYLLKNGEWLGAAPLDRGDIHILTFLNALPDYNGPVSLEWHASDDEIKAAIAYLRNLSHL